MKKIIFGLCVSCMLLGCKNNKESNINIPQTDKTDVVKKVIEKYLYDKTMAMMELAAAFGSGSAQPVEVKIEEYTLLGKVTVGDSLDYFMNLARNKRRESLALQQQTIDRAQKVFDANLQSSNKTREEFIAYDTTEATYSYYRPLQSAIEDYNKILNTDINEYYNRYKQIKAYSSMKKEDILLNIISVNYTLKANGKEATQSEKIAINSDMSKVVRDW